MTQSALGFAAFAMAKQAVQAQLRLICSMQNDVPLVVQLSPSVVCIMPSIATLVSGRHLTGRIGLHAISLMLCPATCSDQASCTSTERKLKRAVGATLVFRQAANLAGRKLCTNGCRLLIEPCNGAVWHHLPTANAMQLSWCLGPPWHCHGPVCVSNVGAGRFCLYHLAAQQIIEDVLQETLLPACIINFGNVVHCASYQMMHLGVYFQGSTLCQDTHGASAGRWIGECH